MKLEFVGANPEVQPVGTERTEAIVSYFTGPEENWKTDVGTYSSVVYKDLWPGIDLVYAGTNGRLKYTFTVAPGADPEQVRLAYRGAFTVKLNEQGRLEIETPVGGFSEDKPYVYQEIAGQRVEVESAYELRDEVYGFRLGDYDHRRPLVLDPVVLVYAGFIGGSGSELGYGIAVDPSGNAYVAGITSSRQPKFPAKVGPDTTYNAGAFDAFVAKVNAAGTALVYAGYIGGIRGESANAIAVDTKGSAYITGYTYSDEKTFPVKGGPDLTYNKGGEDAFVAKVDASGKTLVYAGYIGGAAYEQGTGIAVDSTGNAYVTGETSSNQTSFPVKVGPDVTFNGARDTFVAKVNSAGTALTYAGYIDGSGYEQWRSSIAVDGQGNAYITGITDSNQSSFPVKVGPDLTFNGGGWDAFVARVNTAGSALVYCGYIGGVDDDYASGIAAGPAGTAYIAGSTRSDQRSFPVRIGPDLTHNQGGNDAFVAKVNASGIALDYARYIGGASSDGGMGVAVDAAGNAYITGWTSSDQTSFPVKLGPDLTYNGGHDAFGAKVNPAGTTLLYAGYIGSAADDDPYAIAIDRQGNGNAFVTGVTFGDQKSFPVKVGPDLTYNGGYGDAFVAKVRSR